MQLRAPLYSGCRWVVNDVKMRDELITFDGHLSIYAYADCTVLGLHRCFDVNIGCKIVYLYT